MTFLDRLELTHPIIQAPMAGTATPSLAAAVSNAGALGSIGIGAATPAAARGMIAELRARTNRAFNVNVFCHRAAAPDPARDAAWIGRLAPEFARFGAEPPGTLAEIYPSFATDPGMFAVLLAERPPVASFHFGLPPADRMAALKAAGCVLLASATTAEEARAIEAAGCDAVIAQGYEAGGHRGMFDEDAPDTRLSTLALTRLLARAVSIPVIAAGGIMDGAGIAAVLALGASAAQLGTAFIGCPESAADPAYRAALASAGTTVMTRAVSGRPARCLANGFTAFAEAIPDAEVAPYPRAYDAGKALNAAAKVAGNGGYGAQWAGQGAPLARAMPAAELVATLVRELREARCCSNGRED